MLYNPEDARYKHLAGTTALCHYMALMCRYCQKKRLKLIRAPVWLCVVRLATQLDVEWIKKHNLPIKPILQKDGRFQADLQYIGGLKVKPAREKILAELATQNLIIEQKKIVILLIFMNAAKMKLNF